MEPLSVRFFGDVHYLSSGNLIMPCLAVPIPQYPKKAKEDELEDLDSNSEE
jgi:hypothetical protein